MWHHCAASRPCSYSQDSNQLICSLVVAKLVVSMTRYAVSLCTESGMGVARHM
jgi:hypothetical protein